MYRKWLAYLGTPAVALAVVMLLTPAASAQRFGRGGIGIGSSGLGIGPGYGNGSGFGMANTYGWGGAYNGGYYGGNYYGNGLNNGFNNGYYGSNSFSPGYSTWNRYPSNSGYTWNSYPSTTYSQPGYAYGGQYARPANQTAFYSGAQPNVNVPAGAALITVHVQPDAQLWFEDHQTQQQGPFRQFVTPQLDQNQNYSYTVRARWNQNGQPVDRTKKVTVHAGERMNVDFTHDTGNDVNQLPAGSRTGETIAPPVDRTNINPGTDNLNRSQGTTDNLNRTTNPLPTNPGGTTGTIGNPTGTSGTNNPGGTSGNNTNGTGTSAPATGNPSNPGTSNSNSGTNR